MRDSAPAAPGAPGPAPDAAHRSPLDAASQRLALDKHYVLGFSAVAFLSGVAGAMVYSARRTPGTGALASAAHASAHAPAAHAPARSVVHRAHPAPRPPRAPTPAAPHVVDVRTAPAPAAEPPADPAADVPPLADAAKKGPLALFREMNAAIFSAFRAPPPQRTQPVGALRTARLPPRTGAPDTPPAAPQVGALRTAPTRQGLGVLHKTPQDLPAGVEAPAPDASARSDGPLLAFGAFSLATAIVGGVTLAVVFAVRQALNISTVEEFADWMHANMPRIGRSSALARYVPAVATGPEPAGWAGPPPADLAERMNATEDPIEWAQLVRLQLDHELAEHHAAREERRRLRAQHAQ